MKGAKGLLISITGGRDMTLFEVDEAATRIREEVDAGRQHHSGRDLRRGAGRHDPGVGGRHRY
jgi:cell division GTPase FtsZ